MRKLGAVFVLGLLLAVCGFTQPERKAPKGFRVVKSPAEDFAGEWIPSFTVIVPEFFVDGYPKGGLIESKMILRNSKGGGELSVVVAPPSAKKLATLIKPGYERLKKIKSVRFTYGKYVGYAEENRLEGRGTTPTHYYVSATATDGKSWTSLTYWVTVPKGAGGSFEAKKLQEAIACLKSVQISSR